MPIPDPMKLIQNYPLGDSAAVKARIGGNVNADWITNTCAIRLSHAFNESGVNIPSNVEYMGTVKGGNKKRFAYRVAEFKRWLQATYGKPTQTVAGTGSESAPGSFMGRPGIICFVDCGWSDATGHLDLWDGEKVVNHGYFSLAREILLWERAPSSVPQNRVQASSFPKNGKVTIAKLNVRDRPSSSSNVVGTLSLNQAVTVYALQSGFFQIAQNMWASAQYIQTP